MYDADFIVKTIETVYETTAGSSEIRRVNINAAPMDVEGYRKLHEAGIGTFQIFKKPTIRNICKAAPREI